MNKNELVSHVAAETSATRATAERMVGAVFASIGDALRGTSPLPSPDSGTSSFAAAPRAGVAIRKLGSPSPSQPRRCNRSRRRRPFETRSTDSVAGQAARCRPFVPPTPPRQVHAFAMPTRRSARPGSRELPLRLRQADRRARASRIAWAPDAFHAEGCRTGVRAHSLGRGTFVAGTKRRKFFNRSHVRTFAQWRADLKSPRARVPHMAKCDLPPTPVLRERAHTEYRARYPAAYGLVAHMHGHRARKIAVEISVTAVPRTETTMTPRSLFDRIDQRIALDRQDGDYALFHALMLKLEYVTKVVVSGIVACIGDDSDRHRYTLEHKLVRADSLGI